MNLSGLKIGARAIVAYTGGELGPRLMDIGLIPGTAVIPLLQSPLGDPRAYLIRGAVIALRETDAAEVKVLLE